MTFPLRHRNFICSLRDDLAVGTTNVWFSTEENNHEESVSPIMKLEIETVRVEERLNLRVLNASVETAGDSQRVNQNDGVPLDMLWTYQSPEPQFKKSGRCHPLEEDELADMAAPATNFGFLETPLPIAGSSKRKAVVLDCEMGGSHFNRNELIWVSVVDFFTGETLIHEFVKPSTEILDWRTQFSGVSGSIWLLRWRQRTNSSMDGSKPVSNSST
ncbi:hypothetical protein BZA77DRAFT_356386 [Pyronema omphalodes]|nr:hypothetical protein BZA77DRAFT_356386 [Pyronema omphalodes]